jgi:hypothetical protein
MPEPGSSGSLADLYGGAIREIAYPVEFEVAK